MLIIHLGSVQCTFTACLDVLDNIGEMNSDRSKVIRLNTWITELKVRTSRRCNFMLKFDENTTVIPDKAIKISISYNFLAFCK